MESILPDQENVQRTAAPSKRMFGRPPLVVQGGAAGGGGGGGRKVLGELGTNGGNRLRNGRGQPQPPVQKFFIHADDADDGDENDEKKFRPPPADEVPNPSQLMNLDMFSAPVKNESADEMTSSSAAMNEQDIWAAPIAKLPFVIHEDDAKSHSSSSQLPPLPMHRLPLREYRSMDESLNSSVCSNSPALGRADMTGVDDAEDGHTVSVLCAEEYGKEIHAHLRECELRQLPKWNYMTKQPDITYGMRQILVDWLVEVAEEYKLQTETLFLAVSYIDRFLSYMSVQRAKLQLVGTACMFIAAKYEEIYPPDLSEFVYITDDTYTKKQVLKMEHLVLKVLGFDLAVPTIHCFVNLYAKLAVTNEETLHLAQYLSELSLLDAETYLSFHPSVVAAASVALARHTLGHAAWTQNVVEESGYSVEHFKECLVSLHRTYSSVPDCQQQAIHEKYKSTKFSSVAQVRPIPIV